MADGAHECLGLVRYFDSDGYDVASVPAAIESLLGRLSYLFLDQRGCLKSVSFTSVRNLCHMFITVWGCYLLFGTFHSSDYVVSQFARMLMFALRLQWLHYRNLS